MPSLDDSPPRRSFQFKPPAFTPVNLPVSQELSPRISVHDHLRLNLTIAQRHAPPPPPPVRRRWSRRNRDFALLFFTGCALLLGFGGHLFGPAACAGYTAALSWIMFGIIADY